MKIQWLGTAASEGWPALFCRCDACLRAMKEGGKNLRMRASALIDDVLLIDCNADIYAQKLRFGLDIGAVRDVLITHNHEDHFLKDNFLNLPEPYARGRVSEKLDVYAPENVCVQMQSADYSCVRLHAVEAGMSFDTAYHHVTVLPAVHSAPQSKFYLIERGGKSLLYAHDTDLFSQEAMAILKKACLHPIDLVSFDCCNGPLPHTYMGHMGLEDNAEMKRRLIAEGIVDENTLFYANHFSHNGGLLHEELCEAGLKYGLKITYDGLTAEV